MKKILYVQGWFTTGGIEKYVLNVVDYIDKEKYQIDFILYKSGTYGLEQILVEKGHKIFYYSSDNILGQFFEIRNFLKSERYDIVHVMQGYLAPDPPTLFSIIATINRKNWGGYKVVNHAHGAENKVKVVSGLKKRLRNIVRFLLRIFLCKADGLIACSEEAGCFIYGEEASVRVLYNGIELERFRQAAVSNEISKWRKKYNISENHLNFVIAARMVDVKNPLFVMKIIASLKKYYPHIMLTWIGSGDMLGEVIDLIEELRITDNVNLLGIQEDVEQILACCEYFLLPSKGEGASIAMIEAQATGLRCIASTGVPYFIDCGGTLFIELSKTEDEWAYEIHKYIEDNKKNCDIEQINRFDINETIKELEKYYENL